MRKRVALGPPANRWLSWPSTPTIHGTSTMTQPQPTQNTSHSPSNPSPLVIGICGGIASGKSVVTHQLEKLGAAVIHADQIGHAVLQDPEVIDMLLKHFGNDIRASDNPLQLSRSAIAAHVFGDSDVAQRNLQFLESVTHPRIRQIIHSQLQQLRQQPIPPSAIVLDVPLLFESGWHLECDEIIFVDTPWKDRLQRALLRGWTEKQFTAREMAQMQVSEKEKRSTVTLQNSGTLSEFQDHITQWFQQLTAKSNPS